MNFITPDWDAPTHIKAYTTLKAAWTPLETGDQDRKRPTQHLKTLLRLPSDPIWINQKHTAVAIPATPDRQECVADASFTDQMNRVCVVLTADCLPLLICNKAGTKVAAIHAGWRGLASGIIENTISAFGESGKNVMVWLGPAIGPQKFEVGRDVFDAFTQKMPTSANAFIPYSENKWLADLYALAKMRLAAQGISAIYGGEFCTYTQDDLFFSYRRDKGVTGRMASLIWMDHSISVEG